MNDISLFQAIIFILNVLSGTGAFVNITQLAKYTGGLSPLLYPLIGLCAFPIILICFFILSKHPKSTIYDIGKTLYEPAGFFTTWGYIFCKMGTVALDSYLFSGILLSLTGMAVHPKVLGALCILLFAFLNTANIRISKPIQYVFFFFKISAIFLFIGVGIYTWLYGGSLVEPASFPFYTDLLYGMPYTIFSFAGFELLFSITKRLRNPEQANKVVIYTFFSVVVLYTALQWSCMTIAGSFTEHTSSFKDLVQYMFSYIYNIPWLGKYIMLAVGISALGAGYGILTGNSHNLEVLADNDALHGSKLVKIKNHLGMPYVATWIISSVALLYLIFTPNISWLMQLSACGTVSTYAMLTITYAYSSNKSWKSILLFMFGLLGLTVFLWGMLTTAFRIGYEPYLIYLCVLASGLIYKRWNKRHI